MAQLQSGSGVLWQVPRGAGEEGADHGLGPGLCPVCVGCLGHHHHVPSLTQGWTAAPGVLAALTLRAGPMVGVSLPHTAPCKACLVQVAPSSWFVFFLSLCFSNLEPVFF